MRIIDHPGYGVYDMTSSPVYGGTPRGGKWCSVCLSRGLNTWLDLEEYRPQSGPKVTRYERCPGCHPAPR